MTEHPEPSPSLPESPTMGSVLLHIVDDDRRTRNAALLGAMLLCALALMALVVPVPVIAASGGLGLTGLLVHFFRRPKEIEATPPPATEEP
jgi:hypothetical protein